MSEYRDLLVALVIFLPPSLACFGGAAPEEESPPTSSPPWFFDLEEYDDGRPMTPDMPRAPDLGSLDMSPPRDAGQEVDLSVPRQDMSPAMEDASMRDAFMPGMGDMALPVDPYAGQPYKRRHNVLKDAQGQTVNMILFNDRTATYTHAPDIAPGVVRGSTLDPPDQVCVMGPEQDPWTLRVCYVLATGEIDRRFHGVSTVLSNYTYYADANCQQLLGYTWTFGMGIFSVANDPTFYHIAGPAAGVLTPPVYQKSSRGDCEVARLYTGGVNYYWHKTPAPPEITRALPNPPYTIVRE